MSGAGERGAGAAAGGTVAAQRALSDPAGWPAALLRLAHMAASAAGQCTGQGCQACCRAAPRPPALRPRSPPACRRRRRRRRGNSLPARSLRLARWAGTSAERSQPAARTATERRAGCEQVRGGRVV